MTRKANSSLNNYPKPQTVRMHYKNLDYMVELQARVAFADSRFAESVKAEWLIWVPLERDAEDLTAPAIVFLKEIINDEKIRWPNKQNLGVTHLDGEFSRSNYRIVSRLHESGNFDGFYLFTETTFTRFDRVEGKNEIEVGTAGKILPLANNTPLNLPDFKVSYSALDAPDAKNTIRPASNSNSFLKDKHTQTIGTYDTLFTVGILIVKEKFFILLEDNEHQLRGWSWETDLKSSIHKSYCYGRSTNTSTRQGLFEIQADGAIARCNVPVLQINASQELEAAIKNVSKFQLSNKVLGL